MCVLDVFLSPLLESCLVWFMEPCEFAARRQSSAYIMVVCWPLAQGVFCHRSSVYRIGYARLGVLSNGLQKIGR